MSKRDYDWPLSLAACHGRIEAYRSVLRLTENAIISATPYVNNVQSDPSNSPWRKETAEETMKLLRNARDRIAAELAVTNPEDVYEATT